MTRDLPPEIILLICHNLCKKDIIRLLTINWNWFTVVGTLLYNEIVLYTRHDLYAYRNLFNETRRRRNVTQDHGFYSRQNYGHFVRTLDLSKYQAKHIITDTILDDLTRDCINLERLNLYNCHAISRKALWHVMDNCPRIRHLNLAFATKVDAKFLVHDRTRFIETLNIDGINDFFSTCKGKDIAKIRLSSLRTLECSSSNVLQIMAALLPYDCLETIVITGSEARIIQDFLSSCASHLRVVRLKQCLRLTGETLARLPTSLERLEFEACRVSAQALAYITMYDHLETLNIRGANISEAEALQILHRCSSHRLKRLFTATSLTRGSIDTLLHKFHNLTHVALKCNANADEDLPSLPSTVTYLEIDDAEERLFRWSSSSIRELLFLGILTEKVLELFPTWFPNVEILYVRRMEYTEDQILGFVHQLPNLRGVYSLGRTFTQEKLRRMEQLYLEWRNSLDFFGPR